jgi:hypothetical protein
MDACTICAKIPPTLVANTGRGEHLPAEVSPLVPRKGHYSAIGTSEDLWECPECGVFYIYTTETAFTGSGNNDTDTLDRMTREQSTLVRAVLDCTADPAASEDAFFALPALAFEHALWSAFHKDRDYVALWTPRLVLEYAKRGPFSYGSHPTRDVLHALVESRPSCARVILDITTNLPPELRANLGDLEKKCAHALGQPLPT